MDDLFSEALGPLFRGLFRIGRFLVWELLFESIGWTIGWMFWRGVTLGRFPRVKWSELEQADFVTSLVVEGSGIAILVGLGFWAYV